MPTYQYACTNADCGNRFELVQSFTDPSASDCPVCGSAVRKVFSSVGVVFKGSGFYRTDSRAAAGKSDGSPAAAKESTSDKKQSASDKKESAASSGSSATSSKAGSSSTSTSSGSAAKAAASA